MIYILIFALIMVFWAYIAVRNSDKQIYLLKAELKKHKRKRDKSGRYLPKENIKDKMTIQLLKEQYNEL